MSSDGRPGVVSPIGAPVDRSPAGPNDRRDRSPRQRARSAAWRPDVSLRTPVATRASAILRGRERLVGPREPAGRESEGKARSASPARGELRGSKPPHDPRQKMRDNVYYVNSHGNGAHQPDSLRPFPKRSTYFFLKLVPVVAEGLVDPCWEATLRESAAAGTAQCRVPRGLWRVWPRCFAQTPRPSSAPFRATVQCCAPKLVQVVGHRSCAAAHASHQVPCVTQSSLVLMERITLWKRAPTPSRVDSGSPLSHAGAPRREPSLRLPSHLTSLPRTLP